LIFDQKNNESSDNDDKKEKNLKVKVQKMIRVRAKRMEAQIKKNQKLMKPQIQKKEIKKAEQLNP